MFLRLLTIAIICLAVKGEDQVLEKMNPNPNYLMQLAQLRSPAFFKSECPPVAADLVFALDSSASIHTDYFTKGKELVSKSVAELNSLGLLGSGEKQTRVGVFQFGADPYESFPLMDKDSDIVDALKGVLYQNSSQSKIADAVNWVLNQKDFFSADKRAAKQVLVIVTDCLDNCVDAQEKAAKANADKAGLDIVVVTYTGDFGTDCVQTFTGGDKSKHHLWSDVSGVATLTTDCVRPDIVCYYNGTAHCDCKPGFTGKDCKDAINHCDPDFKDVDYDGTPTHANICHNGKCIHNDITGAHCVCDECFYGDFCEHFNATCKAAQRCILYKPDPPIEVTYQCDLHNERCVPDVLNCAANVGVSHDKDGKPYCPEASRSLCDGMCKCKRPLGWCIPLETANTIFRAFFKSVAPLGKYIVPEQSAL